MSEFDSILDQLDQEAKKELQDFYAATMLQCRDSTDEVVRAVARDTSDGLLALPPDRVTVTRDTEWLMAETGYSSSTMYRVRDDLVETLGECDMVEYDDGTFTFHIRLLLAAKVVEETIDQHQ
jgi:hypothetical protein